MVDRITWEEAILEEMQERGESFDDVISTTLTNEELNKKFDPGFGATQGIPFTLWTNKRVYFPVVYDGAEWVASAPRNPSREKMKHVGGG